MPSCSLLSILLLSPTTLGRSRNWEGRAGFSQGFGVQGSFLEEKEGSFSNLGSNPSRNPNLPSPLGAGICLPGLPSPALPTTPWHRKCPGKSTCGRFGKLPWCLCVTEGCQLSSQVHHFALLKHSSPAMLFPREFKKDFKN